MLEWLIIGGGIQGTYLSHYLVNKKGVAPHKVRVLDPHAIPLARWNHLTTNTGMTYLRSSRVHHLDLAPKSMDNFLAQAPYGAYPDYLGPYRRPSYRMFQEHCHWVIENHHLTQLRLQGQATGIFHRHDGYRVETDQGSLDAQQVVLAIGRTHLHYPDWAIPSQLKRLPIQHVFEMNFCRSDLAEWSHLVVLGGGITAVQTALALAAQQPGTVTLLMRHGIRLRDLDAAPEWMDPKELDKFKKKSFERRRVLIQRARNRGSIPTDVLQQLQTALQLGQLRLCQDEVISMDWIEGYFNVNLATGNTLKADQMILATGFDQTRPGGFWLDQTIHRLGLRCAECGYPMLDHRLQWLKGLYVMGPLAELQVGPVAPNIIGGRLATERIARGVS